MKLSEDNKKIKGIIGMTLEELEKESPITITVSEAAAIMKVTPQFLRCALQQGRFPFGVGVEMKQWEYYINTRRFLMYMKGEDLEGIKH